MLALAFAAVAYSQETVVQTPLGRIRGVQVTDKETGETLHQFRGIKYGKSPTGKRRFQKPEPVEKWSSEYDATKYGPACAQNTFAFIKDGSDIQSEDCLFLNIHVPGDVIPNQKLSVMVWIHGGGFLIGNGHNYDGTRIALGGNVIVVTINYRLGMFGFLALYHPASLGNYGLWDQKLALQWVHDNIASFGGNPDSVTIFGESAGGFSVSFQSIIPSNKGLFQRVIPQSGVASKIVYVKKKTTEKIAKLLQERTNCSAENYDNFVDCLRNVPTDVLLKASDYWQDQPTDRVSLEVMYGVSVDGDLLPKNPILLLQDPNSPQSQFFKTLDFMTGTTSQEGSLILIIPPSVQEQYGFNISESVPLDCLCKVVIKSFVDDFHDGNQKLQESLCRFYTSGGTQDDQSNRAADSYADFIFTQATADMLEFHAELGGGKTYQYQFSKLSPHPLIPLPAWLKGSGHGDDLLFLFSFVYVDSVDEFTGNDKLVSQSMVSLWTSFAKYGYVNGIL